ncbi:hypothetical protein [Dysgonomonas reticulitermitis]
MGRPHGADKAAFDMRPVEAEQVEYAAIFILVEEVNKAVPGIVHSFYPVVAQDPQDYARVFIISVHYCITF